MSAEYPPSASVNKLVKLLHAGHAVEWHNCNRADLCVAATGEAARTVAGLTWREYEEWDR